MNLKHNLTKTKTYSVWKNMRYRCNKPNHKFYKFYGGKGVSVCKRWDIFLNFLEDMGEKPEGLSLDRINNDGNYEPSNCKWSTQQEQNENSSRVVRFTYGGKTMNMKEWAKELKLNYQTLAGRIKTYGISFEEAISRPKREHLLGNSHAKK